MFQVHNAQIHAPNKRIMLILVMRQWHGEEDPRDLACPAEAWRRRVTVRPTCLRKCRSSVLRETLARGDAEKDRHRSCSDSCPLTPAP